MKLIWTAAMYLFGAASLAGSVFIGTTFFRREKSEDPKAIRICALLMLALFACVMLYAAVNGPLTDIGDPSRTQPGGDFSPSL